jgi:hypothetical protein
MGKKIVGIAACGCGKVVHKMWVTHEVWGGRIVETQRLVV